MTTLYSQDTCPSNCAARAIHNQLAAKKDRGKGLSVFCPRKRLFTISPMQEIVFDEIVSLVHASLVHSREHPRHKHEKKQVSFLAFLLVLSYLPFQASGFTSVFWGYECANVLQLCSHMLRRYLTVNVPFMSGWEKWTSRTRTQKRSDESITVIGTKMWNNYWITMRKHYVGLYVLKLYHAAYNKRVMTWETVFRYIVPLLLHVCSDHWINETQFWHVSKMFSHVTAISLTFSMRSFSLYTSTHAASWISQLSLQTFSLLMPRWSPLFVYSASQTFITILRA